MRYVCEGCKETVEEGDVVNTHMHPGRDGEVDIEICGPVRPVAQDIVWDGDEARLGDVVATLNYMVGAWDGVVNCNGVRKFRCEGCEDRDLARAACAAAMRVLAGVEG